MKVTAYFEAIRKRPDRAVIRDEWIERGSETRFENTFKLMAVSAAGFRSLR